MKNKLQVLFLILGMLFFSCSKDKNVVFDNNKPIDPEGQPTIVVKNYVNRLFIDLLGRAPTDIELNKFTELLKTNELNEETRLAIIHTLQSDSVEIHNDGTYKDVYYYNFHNTIKAKCLAGATDAELSDGLGNISFSIKSARLLGDSLRVYADSLALMRLLNIVNAQIEYKTKKIDIRNYFEYALNNNVYDEINMNSFNFVNASFDDLFGRFPTKTEFFQAYEIIEYNRSGFLFGGAAVNKNEYCKLLTNSIAFSEGVLKWQFVSLFAREATSLDMIKYISQFHATKDVQWLQKQILKTNEYANFK